MIRKTAFTALLFAFIFSFSGLELFGQRTGNIVEIFGKDRVDKTSEGIVIHEFTDGLALRDAIRPGMLAGMQDIVFWQIATGRFERPHAGKVLADNYIIDPEPLKWEKIEVDSAGIFRGGLGRSYVYTEFESPQATIALLEATGHTRVFINGMPQEGDHYDYGHTLIPFYMKEGLNQFVYTYGRFGRVSSKLVIPHKELHFSPRDMTLPSIIRGEDTSKWGSVRVVNASEKPKKGLTISCTLETGETVDFSTDDIMSMAVRKLKYKIPAPKNPPSKESVKATLVLRDSSGAGIDTISIKLNVKDINRHHERTFNSGIDGSVQYYSVAPSTSDAPDQAFVLSVHGASVEATNQTRAYRQKDWCHIVAPTNRRPFGFNWEEWGRLDALEVLHDARRIYSTDTAQTYLTGHSMGGHGTWFLGATYPGKWAAIAPAAGYADIIGYRRAGTDSLMQVYPHFEMIYRGAFAGRTVELAKNYLQSGVYLLHGDADAVVPIEQARMMRSVLGDFHNNFAYYEYPDGSHWYGNHSMDWPPLFDFLKQNTIPETKDVKKIDFLTASPGVSASNFWVRINQQIKSYELSHISAERNNDTISFETKNIENVTFLLSELDFENNPILKSNDDILNAEKGKDITLKLVNSQWMAVDGLNFAEKHPDRYGGFKLAFTNNMLFVYATQGSEEENQWYKNKARYDAETFLYRGNGSIDVIADVDFVPEKYVDRNVIIYGNADNNKAWDLLLRDCPVQVTDNHIIFGKEKFEWSELGTYFIYPRHDSDIASVGVVAGTGEQGMKSLYPNDYFSGITGFPDLLIFDVSWLKDGLEGIQVSGFFGNDWSVKNGDFVKAK